MQTMLTCNLRLDGIFSSGNVAQFKLKTTPCYLSLRATPHTLQREIPKVPDNNVMILPSFCTNVSSLKSAGLCCFYNFAKRNSGKSRMWPYAYASCPRRQAGCALHPWDKGMLSANLPLVSCRLSEQEYCRCLVSWKFILSFWLEHHMPAAACHTRDNEKNKMYETYVLMSQQSQSLFCRCRALSSALSNFAFVTMLAAARSTAGTAAVRAAGGSVRFGRSPLAAAIRAEAASTSCRAAGFRFAPSVSRFQREQQDIATAVGSLARHGFSQLQHQRRNMSSESLPYHLVQGMPALSPTMESGVIAEWNVAEGDAFAAGDALAEIEVSDIYFDRIKGVKLRCALAFGWLGRGGDATSVATHQKSI